MYYQQEESNVAYLWPATLRSERLQPIPKRDLENSKGNSACLHHKRYLPSVRTLFEAKCVRTEIMQLNRSIIQL